MQRQNQRYVFIEFEDLKHIKFKKLERVCSRMFVLIDAEEESIPVDLVRQTQRLGKHLKWIAIDTLSGEDMTYHIAFLMGRMHQKVSKEVEFAILSNDATLDALVSFINSEGRNCLRVKRKRTEIEQEISDSIHNINQTIEEPPKEEVVVTHESDATPVLVSVEEGASDAALVEHTARETVKKLIRSGNRPAELSMLKSYILLHNQDLTDGMNIEKILNRLLETNEIQIENEEVVYNF